MTNERFQNEDGIKCIEDIYYFFIGLDEIYFVFTEKKYFFLFYT